jgi:hypothetical protein
MADTAVGTTGYENCGCLLYRHVEIVRFLHEEIDICGVRINGTVEKLTFEAMEALYSNIQENSSVQLLRRRNQRSGTLRRQMAVFYLLNSHLLTFAKSIVICRLLAALFLMATSPPFLYSV